MRPGLPTSIVAKCVAALPKNFKRIETRVNLSTGHLHQTATNARRYRNAINNQKRGAMDQSHDAELTIDRSSTCKEETIWLSVYVDEALV